MVLKLSVLFSKALARLVEATAWLGKGESMVGCWTLMKLERILERGLPFDSETLRREEGDLPRGLLLSSVSVFALFSKSDLRFRTAEEDRCSVMAVWERRRVYQLQHFRTFSG
jgi:hypothetical protein